MTGYIEHANRLLDVTVEDGGLPAVLEFLAGLDAGKGIDGTDPSESGTDRRCLAWRLSSDGTAAYVGTAREEDDPDLDLDGPGWHKVRGGLRPEKTADAIRRALASAPVPRSDCDGTTAPGWRIMEPMAAALEYEDDPDAFGGAFAYIERYTCEYPK